jgi:predicted lipoprotein with Yx(FWY)xxD motif
MHDHENQTSPTVNRPPQRRLRRTWVAVPFAMGALALTAACNPYTAPSTAGASAPAPAATGALVAPASTDLGMVLVNGQGRTVYDFANDTGSTSTCNGDCARDWMPVAAPATLPASLPGVPADLGSTTRDDGTRQLTVAGHPVYTFEGDTAPGQTNGNGLILNGGLWTAVSPAGASPATGTSSGTTGY